MPDEVYFADENQRYCHTTKMNISHHNTVGKTCNYCLVCMCILILYNGMYLILMFIIKSVISMYRAVNTMYSICQCYVWHLSNP